MQLTRTKLAGQRAARAVTLALSHVSFRINGQYLVLSTVHYSLCNPPLYTRGIVQLLLSIYPISWHGPAAQQPELRDA